MLKFTGSSEFRQVLLLSLLSGKPVTIDDVRSLEDDPGLLDHEVTLLKLLDELTNGGKMRVNETGTRVNFHPGVIIGGEVDFDCGTSVSLSYFLEPLICLAPFAKKKFSITLHGVTHGFDYISVDTVKHVTISYCKRLGLHSAELTISKRGYPPLGGGSVTFTCNTLKTIKPIQWIDPGKVWRIRGVASCSRMSPATNPRVIDRSHGILNAFLPDVYIYNEHLKGFNSGKSSGHSLCLYTESTTEVMVSVDCTAQPQTLPEDLATETTQLLLDTIHTGGCVDSRHQYLPLLFMALSQSNVSTLCTGPLTPFSISFLRNLKLFLGVVFKIKVKTLDSKEVGNRKGLNSFLLLSCLGAGFENINRAMI